MKKFNIFDSKFEKIVLCIIVVLSMFIVPSYIGIFLESFIDNIMLCDLLANFLYCSILLIIFYKELKSEFKSFKNRIKESISDSFKWYFVGILIMIVSNFLLIYFLGGISDNEEGVREYISNYPLYAFLSVSVFAPVIEEIVFRKSIMRTTKNKYLGSIISALLFGLAHVVAYIPDSILNILYLVPYAGLGFGFAMMNYENKSIFNSIVYHSIHNTFSFIIIVFNSLL